MRRKDDRRGSRHQRGYGHLWNTFRQFTFPSLLLGRGIVICCGAQWAYGAHPASHCARQGRLTTLDLALHHSPPLRDGERLDPRIVCNIHRVVFLCRACHDAIPR